VLDYDGTMVSTQERLKPPAEGIVNKLIELVDNGILLAFATGRGGSVGEILRAHVPARLLGSILVGYYNGAHIVPLEVDIDKSPPDPDAIITNLHSRLSVEPGLFVDNWLPKKGPLQITVPFERFAVPAEGIERIAAVLDALSTNSGGSRVARMMRSGHSVDIFPSWASKFRVVEEARRILNDSLATILTIGDSGDCQGNDYDLLAGALGLSVDRVCHRDSACWNPLPLGISGPDGLARILLAVRPLRRGAVRVDVAGLFDT
jgi:hydroxymethylpyrimidine pyrophosphatase-like HAD family hydrolase